MDYAISGVCWDLGIGIPIFTYLYLFGESYLGSVNWIDFHGIRFQPSELAKPIMIIAVALLFERFCSKLRNNRRYTRYG